MPTPTEVRTLVIILLLFASTSALKAQRVGLVMSGGGAAALAHIGVIKALEEHNIPIDYITGTSMGAFIGAMYAIGYSPEQMDSLVMSGQFQLAAGGDFENKYRYYYYNQGYNASMVKLMINNKLSVQSILPTNLVKPTLMDLMLMENMSAPAAMANYDFDNLMVPFRSIAADIYNKEQVIFRKGNLSEAIRASLTYPFFFEPVKIGDRMLFDGGLYNNFPIDVLYHEFMPDYIIGSNVTGAIDPPTDDDLLSQVKNMIMDRSSFDPVCENGIIIQSNLEVGVFDFSNIRQVIDRGYDETLKYIDTLRAEITRIQTPAMVDSVRKEFLREQKPLSINKISVNGVTESQSMYVNKVIGLRKKEDAVSFDQIRHRFYHLIQDDKIRYAYPSAYKNEHNEHYTLNVYVKKEKEISVEFGGHVSSKPVNTGYVGVKYNHFARRSISLSGNTYFGKFYGSVHTQLRFEFPGQNKLSLEPVFTLNRWDYFKSFANFFEESKPSFIVQNDWYTGLIATKPFKTHGILQVDVKYAQLRDQYYQNDLFTPSDITDRTFFRNITAGLKIEMSSLNKKQFPTEGKFFDIKFRYINGREETILGSTSNLGAKSNHFRSWGQLEMETERYFRVAKFFSPGISFKGMYSGRPAFSNYSATIISAPAFQPVPESRTFFQEEFRAHKYLAGGIKALFNFTKSVHLRIEGYSFLPYQRITRNEENEAVFGTPWERPFFMSSAAIVYHSPLGPLSFSANYYENRPDEHWSFLFSFGYVIFNKRAFE